MQKKGASSKIKKFCQIISHYGVPEIATPTHTFKLLQVPIRLRPHFDWRTDRAKPTLLIL